MKKVQEEWVNSQLEKARVPVSVGESVKTLLAAWATCTHIDKHGDHVLAIFSKLAVNHAIVFDSAEESWIQVEPGFIKVGDEVRVRHDAYPDDVGRLHNGRRGKVVATRYGDIIIKTTDNVQPAMSGAHHSPYKLEKLVVQR